MAKGFTLLEVLITLSILFLLSAFAFTNSINYLTKAQRLDGKLALMDLAARMETYFLSKGTYETARIGSQSEDDILQSNQSSQGFYQLSIISQTKENYLLKAEAMGVQSLRDPRCQSLWLSSTGEQTAKNRDCWR